MASSGMLCHVALVRTDGLEELTRATRHNIPEDAILHSHHHENLKSYILTFVLYKMKCQPSNRRRAVQAAMLRHGQSNLIRLMWNGCYSGVSKEHTASIFRFKIKTSYQLWLMFACCWLFCWWTCSILHDVTFQMTISVRSSESAYCR
jgi:hypothetical protein